MNGTVGTFEGFFQSRGRLVCFAMGLVLAVAFAALALATTKEGASVLFFFANLPFLAWMIVTAIVVLFSQQARDMLADEQTNPIGGLIVRLTSPFGLFFYAWRFGFLILTNRVLA